MNKFLIAFVFGKPTQTAFSIFPLVLFQKPAVTFLYFSGCLIPLKLKFVLHYPYDDKKKSLSDKDC